MGPGAGYARRANGEVRAIESPAPRFFIATRVSATLCLQANDPPPVIVRFRRAVAEFVNQQEKASSLR